MMSFDANSIAYDELIKELRSRLSFISLNELVYTYEIISYMTSESNCASNIQTIDDHITPSNATRKLDIIVATMKFISRIESNVNFLRLLIERGTNLIYKNKAAIEYESYRDLLTDTYNFNHLKRIERQLSKEDFVVYFFDLNGLKKVNDQKGHEYGNLYIKTFAKALTDSVRLNDIVCRYGGDEFIVIVFRYETDLTTIIERISNHLTDTQITFSVGWAKNTHRNLFKAIKEADQHMYIDKFEQRSAQSEGDNLQK